MLTRKRQKTIPTTLDSTTTAPKPLQKTLPELRKTNLTRTETEHIIRRLGTSLMELAQTVAPSSADAENFLRNSLFPATHGDKKGGVIEYSNQGKTSPELFAEQVDALYDIVFSATSALVKYGVDLKEFGQNTGRIHVPGHGYAIDNEHSRMGSKVEAELERQRFARQIVDPSTAENAKNTEDVKQ